MSLRTVRQLIPMVITLFRLVLGPAFAMVYSSLGVGPGRQALAFLLMVISIFTDWLDGYLARRWNAVSTLGKLLDPFADALFCMVVLAWFAHVGSKLPWAVVIILICREAIATYILRPVALSHGVVMAARMIGKVKTSFQFGLMVTLLVANLPGEKLFVVLHFLRWVATWLQYVGFVVIPALSVISLVVYIFDLRAALRKTSADADESNDE